MHEGQIVGLNEKISEFKEEKAYLFNQPNNATGLKHKEPVAKVDEKAEIKKLMLGQ